MVGGGTCGVLCSPVLCDEKAVSAAFTAEHMGRRYKKRRCKVTSEF